MFPHIKQCYPQNESFFGSVLALKGTEAEGKLSTRRIAAISHPMLTRKNT